MIPMSELLTDPTYRRFLETKPETPEAASARSMSPQWVVYIQKDVNGPWGKRSFRKYKKALKFFQAWMERGCHDAAINNKRIAFDPPSRFVRIKGKYVEGSDGKRRQATKRVVWRVPARLAMDQPEHEWCRYCRRPTVFKYYSKHKRLGVVRQDVRRCCICGAAETIAVKERVRV